MTDIKIDQMVSATQAAKMSGLKLRSFLYHIRKGSGPTPVICMGVKGYLREDVKEWNKNRPKPKKGKPA